MKVEYGDRHCAADLRGLAKACGEPVSVVAELAARGQLGVLFRGGKVFHYRSADAPPRTLPQRLLELRRRRLKWSAPQ